MHYEFNLGLRVALTDFNPCYLEPLAGHARS
jgi:hypothetical protein